MAMMVSALLLFAPRPARAAKGGGSSTHLPTASGMFQEKLKPLQASMKAREPVFISGRTLNYDRKLGLWTIEGDAKVSEGATTITADTIKFQSR
ncbi:MAG TPA: hypothetical protein VNF29_13790, partial [Candidatus Binataceae bacterium]|nr:hypothetical protein [Candidatus Binataceae bacterium]